MKRSTISKALCILQFLIPLSLSTGGMAAESTAESTADKLSMVVLGDSVTMGVWADSNLGDPGSRFYREALQLQVQANLMALVSGRKVNDLSNAKKYASVIDRFFGFISRKHLSGLIGNQEYSVPTMIKERTGRDVEVIEATVMAGCYEISEFALSKLDKQIKRNGGQLDPDFVFVDFNAMDFVFNVSTQLYQQNVRRTLAAVVQRFPRATIVASPLVNMVRVMTTLFDKLTIPGRLGLGRMTCAQSYNRIGFDQSLGLNPSTPPEEVSAKLAKLGEMQAILGAELDALGRSDAEFGFDGFEGRVIRVESASTRDDEIYRYLAADCIHPNVEGQKLLARQIWAAIEAEL